MARDDFGLVADVGDRIFFDFDSILLDDEDMAQIERWVVWIQENPELTLALEGHTDQRGTVEYNCQLGLHQALAVYDVLIYRGIDATRLQPITYGEHRPAVLGENEAAWAQNRRVVMVIRNPESPIIINWEFPRCLRSGRPE